MTNEAPEGKIWVCCACGKTSKDLYGGPTAMRFWDESCMLNAQLFAESLIERGEDGRVIQVKDEVGG